ncbi:MAG: toll/interleukin-1 receptor domain-containing protein, partial [Nevskia sp.]|nr:toll/interleukin-1 receptor domain-containing protein [Nevskia sp.]
MPQELFKYWAFISYSHRDRAWAEWLHKALETYRVPRRLIGRETAAGPVPRRLFPVFRDQEELPSSPNLSAAIDQALLQSRYL